MPTTDFASFTTTKVCQFKQGATHVRGTKLVCWVMIVPLFRWNNGGEGITQLEGNPKA